MNQNKVYYHKSLGGPIVIEKLDPCDQFSYPSDVFKNKPSCTIKIPKRETQVECEKVVISTWIKSWETGRPDMISAKAIIYFIGLRMEKTDVSEDWISFDHNLVVDKKCSPWTILTVEAKEDEDHKWEVNDKDFQNYSVEGQLTPEGLNTLRRWSFLIMSANRLVRTNYSAYDTELRRQFQAIMDLWTAASDAMTSVTTGVVIPLDTDLKKMIAAIDMFLVKFNQQTEFDRLRWATIPCRYRNCTALTSIMAFHLEQNISQDDLLDWILHPRIAEDYLRCWKHENEVGVRHSYTPYLMDLGMCTQSPYSTTSNSAIYTFLHAFGSFSLNRRSLRARYLDRVGQDREIFLNALIFSFVMCKTVNLEIQFYKQKFQDEGSSLPVQVDSSGFDFADPDYWIRILSDDQGQLPRDFLEYCKNITKSIECEQDLRQDTIASKFLAKAPTLFSLL